ncbi:hypothetical protein NQ317_001597 [Molorchus minor]|uniref:tRNA-splicing endonuclease subunit Sen15 domain-containing protein n=1 Tax=Molorchus minor TaxID=1323400 RepID=A0ABQ9J6L7_9CUCU|nr:hypothetical protein NQ317_001597 [Molorchus minor]
MNESIVSEFAKYVLRGEAVITSHVYLELSEIKSEDMHFKKIQYILKEIQQNTVFLVIVHSDSTCVYYQLTDGLVQPTDSMAKHLKENKQEKLDSDLKKNRDLLEQSALFGYKITLNKCRDNSSVETSSS